MKENIFILGVGRNTPVYIDLALSCNYEIGGLFHYNNEKNGLLIHGFEILGSFEDLFSQYKIAGENFAMSMGDNKIRREISQKIRENGGMTPNLINPSAYVSRFVKMGTGVAVHANASIQADVIIGDDSVISFNVDLVHNSVVEEGCFIAGGSIVGAYTHMKKYSFVGIGAKIVSGKVSTIGENSMIGAGAVVLNDVPDYAIVAGVPARIIKNIPRKY